MVEGSDAKFGGWSMTGHPLSIEGMSRAGFDFVGLDLQHGSFDLATAVRSVQLLNILHTEVLARISVKEIDRVPQLLDAGADGAILAMVESVDDVRTAVSRMRYQPVGTRSYGAQRYELNGEPEQFEGIQDVQPAVYAMIETKAAFGAVEEIAAVPGLAGLFVGPTDLCLALGLHPSTTDADFASALDRVIAAAVGHGLSVGTFATSGAESRELADRGFTHVVIGSDIRHLINSSEAELGAARRP